MALALYRKYRPRTFAEVIGQEHVTEPLSQALRTGRLHHAYLFSGPRGCGKTSSARILARSLNCEQGPTPDPCGKCESCIALAPDGSGSIDVIEIDAASHGGVDDARDLRERAFFAPVASRFKVYVIDEAHMVSSAGFNALLKLVEEPPDYVKFVFATTEPEKVLGTIKSRTHHYPFRLIPPGVLRPYLEQLTNAEGVKVEPAVFPLVVRAGGGSARDTLSVLDQLIAGAGPEGVSYTRAVALLGVTDVALIDEMCDALAASDGAGAYGVIDRVVEAGHDPRRFASDLLERLRDLIILQQVPDAVTKGLLDAPEDQLERMAAEAAHLGMATLSRFADIVHNGLTEMRGTTAPRLLLELICARMLLPGVDDATGALLQRLERMERRLAAAGEAPALLSSSPEAGSTAGGVPAGVAAGAPAGVVSSVAGDAAAGARSAARSAAARPVPAATDQAPADLAQAPADGARASADVAPSGDRAAPAASPVPASTTATEAPGPAAAQPGALDAVAVRRVWDEVLTIVSRKSKRAWAVVREATVRDIEGDTLVLVFKHPVHAEMLSKSPEILVEALYELLGGRWQLRCEVGGAGSSPAGSSRLQSPPARPPTEPPAPRSAPSAAKVSQPVTAEEWPTPAQVGGRAANDDAEGWPTPAQPGRAAPGEYMPDLGDSRSAESATIAPGALPSGTAAVPGASTASAAGPSGPPSGAGSSGGSISAAGGSGGSISGHGPDDVPWADAPSSSIAGGFGTSSPIGALASGVSGSGGPGPGVPGSGVPSSGAPGTGVPGPDVPGTGAPGSGGGGGGSPGRSPVASARSATAPASATSAAPGSAAPVAAPAPRRSAAAEQARAAASRAGSGQRSGPGQRGANQRSGSGQGAGGAGGAGAGGRGAARAPGGPAKATKAGVTKGGSAWDGTGGDEPPYDPEYDGPAGGDASYPGFDPGDEPLDDADPAANRESTEEAALRLLSEALGAEKIGETGG